MLSPEENSSDTEPQLRQENDNLVIANGHEEDVQPELRPENNIPDNVLEEPREIHQALSWESSGSSEPNELGSAGSCSSDDDNTTPNSSASSVSADEDNKIVELVRKFNRALDESLIADSKFQIKMYKLHFMDENHLRNSQTYHRGKKRELYAECVMKSRILEKIAELLYAEDKRNNTTVRLPPLPSRLKQRLGIRGNLEKQRQTIKENGGLDKYLKQQDELKKRQKSKPSKLKKEGSLTEIGKKIKKYKIRPSHVVLEPLPPTPSTSKQARMGVKSTTHMLLPPVYTVSDSDDETAVTHSPEDVTCETGIHVPLQCSESVQNIFQGNCHEVRENNEDEAEGSFGIQMPMDVEDLERSNVTIPTTSLNSIPAKSGETVQGSQSSLSDMEIDNQVMNGIISCIQPDEASDDHSNNFNTNLRKSTINLHRPCLPEGILQLHIRSIEQINQAKQKKKEQAQDKQDLNSEQEEGECTDSEPE